MHSRLKLLFGNAFKRPLFFFASVLVISLAYATLVSLYGIVSANQKHRRIPEENWFCLEYITEKGLTIDSLWKEHFQLMGDIGGDLIENKFSATYRYGGVTFKGALLGASYTELDGDLLKVFGLRMVDGRNFNAVEYSDSADVAIVSEEFVRRVQVESPLGQVAYINRKPYTVIGVFRKSLLTPHALQSDVYTPSQKYNNQANPWDPSVGVFVKLRSGIPPKIIEGRLTQSVGRLSESSRMVFAGDRAILQPLGQLDAVGRSKSLLLIALAGLVIFIAGLANVSGLMIVNTISLENELKTRAALGASSRNLYLAAGKDGVGVTVAGSLVGFWLVGYTLPIFAAVCGVDWSDNVNLFRTQFLDLDFIGMNVALSVVILLTLTFVPGAYAVAVVRNSNLVAAGRRLGVSRKMKMIQNVYASAQIACAVVMVSLCALFFISLQDAQKRDLGFDRSNRMKVSFDWGEASSATVEQKRERLARIQDAIMKIPEVREVGLGTDSILAGHDAASLSLVGEGDHNVQVALEYISPRFQYASGMRLKLGRWFDSGSHVQILVNEEYVRKFRPGTSSPLGQFIRSSGTGADIKGWEIVGVVGDVSTLIGAHVQPKVYFPIEFDWSVANNFIVWHNGSLNPNRLRMAVEDGDPNISIVGVATLENLLRDQLAFEITMTKLLAIFSGVAVGVSFLGSLALMAQRFALTGNEYGLRLALGASQFSLAWRFANLAAIQTVVGALVGVTLVFAALPYIASSVTDLTSSARVSMFAVPAAMVLLSPISCLQGIRSIFRLQPIDLLKTT